MKARKRPGEDPIAGVDFRVYHNGHDWTADVVGSKPSIEGNGSTPITALMVAEAKARKAVR